MAISPMSLRKYFVEQVTLLLLFPHQALEGQVQQAEPNLRSPRSIYSRR